MMAYYPIALTAMMAVKQSDEPGGRPMGERQGGRKRKVDVLAPTVQQNGTLTARFLCPCCDIKVAVRPKGFGGPRVCQACCTHWHGHSALDKCPIPPCTFEFVPGAACNCTVGHQTGNKRSASDRRRVSKRHGNLDSCVFCKQ